MPDQKTTDLSALTALADADVLMVVDVSDTAMDASGTNKKITKSNASVTLLTEIPESSPSTPAANTLTVFNRDVGGRQMLAMVGPSGLDSALQPTLARNAVCFVFPYGNATTLSSNRMTLTATGTATAASVAVTNLHTMMKRLDYLVTAPTTSAVAGWRYNQACFALGNDAKIGGFHYVCRWGPATGVSTSTNRAFVGMRGSTSAPTDVQPSSLTNIVGMAWDAADSNIQIMHNDGSGTATKVDLGGSFPVPTTDRAHVYEIVLFSAPNSGVVSYQVTDLVTDATTSGTISTDLPSGSTLLTPLGYMSVGGTSSVIGAALMGLYIETDY